MFAPGTFFFGVLLPLAAVALVAFGIWELVRSGRSDVAGASAGGAPVPLSGSARSILDERFARGELDADEYVSRRALLDGTVPSPPMPEVPIAEPEAFTVDSAVDTVESDVADPEPDDFGDGRG